ncbi:MAG: FecR domain-containing protein, partial [Anaerolineae bacterium]|nr:FecR domain-containing protein [Anaerolineae bacterium]
MENDRAFADILNDCLEAIAAGEASIEGCLARYPQHAAHLEKLLRLSDSARGVSLPTPTPEMLAAGERRFVQAARAKAAQARGGQKNESLLDALKIRLRAGPRWVLPVAALSASVTVLFICAILAVIGGSLAWRGLRNTDALRGTSTAAVAQEGRDGFPSVTPITTGPTITADVAQPVSPLPEPTATPKEESKPVHTVYLPLAGKPLPPHRAMLQELQGVVEVQDVAGDWSVASDRQTIEADARVRTGALSRANIMFYDGSTAYLEPNTEVSIDALGQNSEDQSRIVELTQWVGETDHDVAPSYGTKARYEVHTPSGTGAAKGTFFHVSVTTAMVVHFRVDEGAVAVTHLDVTVVVIAGQLTTIQANTPPSKPVFRVSGEGQVEATGAAWRIAGQNFQTHAATVIVGNPQVGDWVHVDGRLLADGTRVADRIVLLRRLPANRFTLTGEVEAMGALTWTVAGQEIAVDEATAIDEGIQVGDRVRIEGVIEGPESGALLAETIALVDERGVPFSFVGVVQEIAESYWVVSGVSVTLNTQTVIKGDLAVGDIARVRGVFLDDEDTTWLARMIEPVEPQSPSFAFTGKVEATGTVTWTVAGQAIAVDGETEIESGIEVEDWVRVEGRIEPDGTLRAESIHLVETPALLFAFVGTVEKMVDDYWIVSGISVTVDAETVIDDGLAVGDVV